MDRRVDEIFNYYIDNLKGSHAGDCTCCPCSCEKCHAEVLLGIDTIKGLPKHAANAIESESKKFNSIDEVINSLDNYVPDRTEGGWDKETDERWNHFVPRFIEHSKLACEWLKHYKEDKLK